VPSSNRHPKDSLANTSHSECRGKNCEKYIPRGEREDDLEGDVFVEGESESFRLGLIVPGNAAIQYCLLKILCESRHPPPHESIKESKERRHLVLVVF
jgi:hypothetical protein